ncbi:hypothetical protein ABPG74_000395 [Tetrahymena malaccensis]
MRKFIILILLALSISGSIAQDLDFKKQYYESLQNATDQELLKLFGSFGFYPNQNSERFQLFKKRVAKIVEHNLNPNKKYSQKISKFTFYTNEEISKLKGSQNCSATAQENTRILKTYDLSEIPDYVDWRQKGIVSSVKNQDAVGDDCGSCWTFSATGAIESHLALKTGKAPLNLSQQQLVDCAGNFDNQGCDGGLPSRAFEYIAYAGGIETNRDYPYKGKDGKCKFKPSKVAAKVKSSFNITFQDENELIYHLANNGPVSIAYQVTDDFENYESGIYSNPDCSTDPQEVNHAVLAVGYNLTGRYYIVKNSWGKDWGMDGYFYIELGSNMCGLADCASYPILDDQTIDSQDNAVSDDDHDHDDDEEEEEEDDDDDDDDNNEDDENDEDNEEQEDDDDDNEDEEEKDDDNNEEEDNQNVLDDENRIIINNYQQNFINMMKSQQ